MATVGPTRAPVADVAAAATGLTARRARLQTPAGSRQEAMLVHDGPVGREAWLYVVADPDRRLRWVFATGSGTYERAAGAPLGGPE